MKVCVAYGIAIVFWLLMFWLFGVYALVAYAGIGFYTVFKTRKLRWYVEPAHNLIGKD